MYKRQPYSVSGGTATFTALTKTGAAISARSDFGMVGDATSGVIFGGQNESNTRLNDFYSYSVSGSTITITALTKSGAAISARRNMSMLGDSTSGLIGGGNTPTLVSDFYRYSISASTVTLTALTKAGESVHGFADLAIAGDLTSGVISSGRTWDHYTISGDTITFGRVGHFTRGTISDRHSLGMVGNASAGLVFGGNDYSVRLNDAYYYTVELNSGLYEANQTALTKTGAIPARSNFGMVGNIYSGLIYGGFGQPFSRLNDMWMYRTNATRGGTAPTSGLMLTQCLTQTAYDAISTKDPNTLYFITG